MFSLGVPKKRGRQDHTIYLLSSAHLWAPKLSGLKSVTYQDNHLFLIVPMRNSINNINICLFFRMVQNITIGTTLYGVDVKRLLAP